MTFKEIGNYMEDKGFWNKHGASMVEYLILAGIIGIFAITWQFQAQISRLQSDSNLFLARQVKVMDKQDLFSMQISDIKAKSVSRAELQNSMDRMERILEKATDKIDKASNKK